MAVYIEGHAESLEAAADKGVAAEERLRRETEKLNAEQSRSSKGFASYSTQVNRSAKESERHAKATSKLSSGMKSAAATGAAFVGAYAGYSALKDSVDYTEELVHSTLVLTRVTDMDTKEASQWIEMARQRGIDMTKLGMAFTTLSKQIRGAETGSKTARKNFHALGIPLEELRHLSTQDVLMRIADAFKNSSDGAEKAALNQAFFGKSARDLLPVLDKGSAGLKEQLGMFDGLTEAQQKQGEEALAYQRKVGIALDQLKLKVTFGMLGIAKVISSPHLTLDQKINFVMKKADAELQKGVTFLAEHMADHAPEVAEAFAKGFFEAPILGQAIFGSMLFAKLGGVGMLGGLFKEEGKVSATSMASGMKTALPGAVAAIGIGNIVSSATQGDWRDAGFEAGGALIGGIAGAFGGPMGAALGVGIGSVVGELGSHLFGDLFGSSKHVSALTKEIAHVSAAYVQASHTQKAASRGLTQSEHQVATAQKRAKGTTQEIARAEHGLAAARKRYGDNSRQAALAQERLNQAQHRGITAEREMQQVERRHGVMRTATIRADREMVTVSKEKTSALKAEVTQLYHRLKAIQQQPPSKQRGEEEHRVTKRIEADTKKLTETRAEEAKIVKEAATQIGPKFAKSLERIEPLQRRQHEMVKESGISLKEFREGLGTTTSVFPKFGSAGERNAKRVAGAYRALDQQGKSSLGDLGTAGNNFLSALGAKTIPFSIGKASGGPVRVPGSGLMDTVPIFHDQVAAMVAPGEDLFVANRHQRPLLDRAVRNEYGVSDLEGFYEVFDKPHHMARGGIVEPRLTAGYPALRRGGQAELHRAYKALMHYIAKHDRYARIVKNANRMDALHQPYLWGGGHGATASVRGPWDCSGAISELFNGAGWNFAPMVSSGFEGWGLPGSGKVSVLANADHVYAVIGGRAFGTSASNPGGGAGWIDGYTFRPGFTIRHADLGGDVSRPFVGRGGKGQRQRKGFARGGQIVSGRVSWFSGGTTASGKSAASTAGVALNLHPGTEAGWDNSTTRGWMAAARSGHPVFAMVSIAGHSARLPIIDLGPAGSTGRAIDVTAAGVRKLGLSTSDFPTDAVGRAVIGSAAGGPAKGQIKQGLASKGKVVSLPGLKPEHLTGAALGLPAPIQAMLQSPGLSFARKLEIGQYASQLAGTTKDTSDDVAAAEYTLGLEQSNKKRIQRALARIAKELKHRMSPKRRKQLLAQREQLLGNLASADAEINSANETIAGAGGEEGEGSSKAQEELTHQLEEMNELLKQQIANQQALYNVSQSQYGVLSQAITAVVSGQIGGRVGLGFQTPSVAGSLASY